MCPSGWRSESTESTVCEKCSIGKRSNNGSDVCQLCGAGEFGAVCDKCSIGQYRSGNDDNATLCDDCPRGFSQQIEGQASCLPCIPGRYQSFEGQPTCPKCNIDTFTPDPESQICDQCQLGRNANCGSVACSTCGAGKIKIETNATEIKNPDDSFKCTSCLAGLWAQAGDQNCTQCAPGLYQSQSTQASCIKCQAGRWSNLIGAVHNSTCLACLSGLYSSAIGASSGETCNECPSGKFSTTIGAPSQSKCIDCSINTISNGARNRTCETCGIGQFTTSPGSTACLECFPGRYGQGCAKCPLGWKRSEDDLDLTQCVQCKLGESSKNGSSSCDTCDIGKRGDSKNVGFCTSCQIGTYQDARGQDDCVPCRDGKIPNNKSTACEKPPWTVALDCQPSDETFLDDFALNNMEWFCAECPLGANCNAKSTLKNRSLFTEPLLPLPGYWTIPSSMEPDIRDPFAECTFPEDCLFNKTSQTTCLHHTKGTLCSTCIVGYNRESRRCNKCRENEVPIRLTVILLCLILVGFAINSCKSRLKRLHKKYGAAWRDAALAFKILITFAQVSQSLPSTMPGFTFPSSYTNFLDKLSVVNIDWLGLIGIQCVIDMDYRYGVAMAFAVPLTVVIICFSAYLCGKRTILNRKTMLSKEERIKLMGDIFDITDFDQSGEIDEKEFLYLLKKIISKSQHKALYGTQINDALVASGAKKIKLSPTTSILMLSRENFVKSMSSVDQMNGDDTDIEVHDIHKLISEKTAYRWIKLQQLSATWYSAAMQLMLVFHAPVSARAFYYFDCHKIGQIFFLRRDYNIECYEQEWYDFLPFAIGLLATFAFAVPVGLSLIMFCKRNHLYTPQTRVKIGFLYSRYVPGAEWWEIHEVVRKMFLCGLLVYLPPTTRAAAAVLVCVLAIASLNYVRPQKNVYVFWVDQGAFFLTACKYLTTIFAKAVGRNIENSVDDQALGFFLIFFDCIVLVLGGICILSIFFMLQRDMHNLKKSGKVDADWDEDTELMIKKMRRLSSLQNGKKGGRRASAVLMQAQIDKMIADNENKSTLTRQPSRLKSRSTWDRIENRGGLSKVIDHHKADNVYDFALKAKELHLQAMEERKTLAHDRMVQRINKRKVSKYFNAHAFDHVRKVCTQHLKENDVDVHAVLAKHSGDDSKKKLNDEEFKLFLHYCMIKAGHDMPNGDKIKHIWQEVSQGQDHVDIVSLSKFLGLHENDDDVKTKKKGKNDLVDDHKLHDGFVIEEFKRQFDSSPIKKQFQNQPPSTVFDAVALSRFLHNIGLPNNLLLIIVHDIGLRKKQDTITIEKFLLWCDTHENDEKE